MKPGEIEYIGDGVYVCFDGHGFDLRANHHEHPTDRVYIEIGIAPALLRLLNSTPCPGGPK